MHRSELTVDLGAIRRNARTLLRALGAVDLKKSGAHYAVRTLLAKGELEEENGRTVFVDPLFELWLRAVQQGGAGGEDAPV